MNQEREKSSLILDRYTQQELVTPKGEGFYMLFDSEGYYRKRVEEWRNAPVEIIKYDAGAIIINNGDSSRLITYAAGKRMVIGEKQVMDTCELPWVKKTVDEAFKQTANRRKEQGLRNKPIDVLDVGFGLGLVADEVLKRKVGNYTSIELNKQVLQRAGRWKKRMEKQDVQTKIEILPGEAGTILNELVEDGKKFDIIISDTYPLIKGEAGFNDLKYMDLITMLLKPSGVFGFFPFYQDAAEGTEGKLTHEQAEEITKYFDRYTRDSASVRPSKDYKYLQTSKGWVLELPVVVASMLKAV
ncbi:MAG: class I SAM-dependent methyltransferase [Candidatus Levyibacteriota bacterium]